MSNQRQQDQPDKDANRDPKKKRIEAQKTQIRFGGITVGIPFLIKALDAVGGLGATGALAMYLSTVHKTLSIWTGFFSLSILAVGLSLSWRQSGVPRKPKYFPTQAFIIVELVLFVCCAFLYMRELGKPISTAITQSVPTANTSPPSVAVHEERTLLDVKPEYLLGFFKKYTNAEAHKLVETYIGKWLKISGIVDDVYSGKGYDGAYVLIRTDKSDFLKSGLFPVIMGATFNEQRWINRALVLRRGETVTVFGRITKIEETGFMLDKCEIVE